MRKIVIYLKLNELQIRTSVKYEKRIPTKNLMGLWLFQVSQNGHNLTMCPVPQFWLSKYFVYLYIYSDKLAVTHSE
jgi:hypothetical protein